MSEPSPVAAKPQGGLLRSSAVVSVMTMLSRVLGLIRDVVIAAFLGATANADCFFVAFKIPNFLRRLFAEGAFSQAFVPVLSEYRENGSQASVKLLVDRVAGALGGVLTIVTALAVIGAPVVTTIFAPGFREDPLKFQLTSDMIRITFPYLLLISMTGFAGAVLNSFGRFAVPAFTPVLLNVCLISAAVYLSPYFPEPAMALAWGVLMAGVVQLVFQMPFLQRIHMLPRPRWGWQDEGVKRIVHLMIPAMFGVSVSQINLLLDTVLASFLPTGSISWLYYSDRLVELPLGVFAIAIATVILPKLSRQKATGDEDSFARTLDWGLRGVLLIAVPAAVALVILAESILATLFQYGELGSRDVAMAAMSLRAYSLGLIAFMLIKVLAPGFYARQDTKTPVRIGIIAMVANMVMNIALVIPLHYYWQIGHVGLALATAASAWLNAGLLFRGLVKTAVYRPKAGWGRYLLQLLLAVCAMAAVLVWGNQWLAELLQWPWWQRGLSLLALCASGAGAYLLLLILSGLKVAEFRGH
ncbi:murein biosynthesis integral membrane protein MurJ [Spongiibacter sp. IMCC21906]|uniref:murein biosynthesis integral membrane protein MurJ n=1 Tax=Spongiibacter sp. IMCC21906 TaxID=1620392 RepID=UPI00062DD27C|nr:murein biosynthesis integral membrane protein MurJ [Spongiibacter sp. IMCC21906]AKH68963.1 murein biosynthesis integral membrane protein MurJ [Spongiibacter sp. IMCC21906]